MKLFAKTLFIIVIVGLKDIKKCNLVIYGKQRKKKKKTVYCKVLKVANLQYLD